VGGAARGSEGQAKNGWGAKIPPEKIYINGVAYIAEGDENKHE